MSEKWVNYYVDLEIPTGDHNEEGVEIFEFRTFLLPLKESENPEFWANQLALDFEPGTKVGDFGLLEGAFMAPREICTF